MVAFQFGHNWWVIPLIVLTIQLRQNAVDEADAALETSDGIANKDGELRQWVRMVNNEDIDYWCFTIL